MQGRQGRMARRLGGDGSSLGDVLFAYVCGLEAHIRALKDGSERQVVSGFPCRINCG